MMLCIYIVLTHQIQKAKSYHVTSTQPLLLVAFSSVLSIFLAVTILAIYVDFDYFTRGGTVAL